MSRSVQEYLDDAHDRLEEMPPNVELAMTSFKNALEHYPQNAEAHAKYGEFCCNFGDPSEAQKHLQRSVELAPETGSAKYLYLAQLSEGKEALHYYERGLQLCQGETTIPDKIQVYCAISELYLTDLCDEEDAQKQCEKALELAHDLDPESVEVLTALATYNKTIKETQKAVDLAKKAAERVDQLAELTFAMDDPDAELMTVPTETQVSLCRTLIDLRLFELAETRLDALLEQDEEDVQIWYLLALCHTASGDLELATETYEKAVKFSKKHGLEEIWDENLRGLFTRLQKLIEEAPDEAAEEKEDTPMV